MRGCSFGKSIASAKDRRALEFTRRIKVSVPSAFSFGSEWTVFISILDEIEDRFGASAFGGVYGRPDEGI